MQLLSYNIQYTKGLDGRLDAERIASVCRGADIICLQEVERFFSRSNNADQVAELAALMPDYYYVYGPGVDLPADVKAADGRITHRRRQFGNMVLSRYPIASSRNHLLPKYGSVSEALSIQRSAIEALIDHPATRLRVYSTHLSHLTSVERVAQIEALLEIHDRAVFEGFAINGDAAVLELENEVGVQHVPREALILGDFNMQPDSVEYELVAGPVSPYGGRVKNPDGFVDAWAELHGDAGGQTCDDDGVAVRLDYGFVSTALAGMIRSVRVDTDAEGSDHKPLWIELAL